MPDVENKILRRLFYIFIIAAFLSASPLAVVFAQESDPSYPTDDEVNAIAKELYCPVCENVPLDVCGTQACAQWRELIREKLAEGWTEDEIKVYFSNQYGDRVLAEPPARGLNWLVYVIPPLVFFAGAFFLYRGFLAWRQLDRDRDDEIDQTAEPENHDEYISRLEEELKKQ
jgi:cytochrome c-type biogenesis protein CcmH